MANAHSIHLPHFARRRHPGRRAARADTSLDTSALGAPTSRGGHILAVGVSLAIIGWIAALIRLSQIAPADGLTGSWEFALWMIVAGGSIVGMHIMIVWHTHRVASASPRRAHG